MTKLEKYVKEQNAILDARIKLRHKRAPLSGELIDLNTAAGQARLLQHFEYMLEDEVLLQDGERTRTEAAKDERKYTALLNELRVYGNKK